jgi:hypothetical protein
MGIVQNFVSPLNENVKRAIVGKRLAIECVMLCDT